MLLCGFFSLSASTVSSSLPCFPSMVAACRDQQAPLAEKVTLEPMASREHQAFLAVMDSKARKESVLMRSSRSPGGPTTSSVPGTL